MSTDMIDREAYRLITKELREHRPYRPFGSALDAWASTEKELLLCGAAGTGKSRTWLEKLHYCANKYPGIRALICRKTRKSITQSAMVTYEKLVLPEGWLGNLIHFSTTDQQYEYPNGSIIALGGLDDPEKVMSSEWDMIYVQEATELFEKDWGALSSRARFGMMPYQQLVGDCNPSYPSHWLKLRCDRHETRLLESRHEDNPTVTREYLARLDALPGVLRLRLRDGKWAAAEGIVYDEWDRNIHLVSKEQFIAWNLYREQYNRFTFGRYIASVDWGWKNPGCIQVYGLDGDDRMYMLREVYRTAKTIDWWVDQGKQLAREFQGIEQWVCDPSEPAYIQAFNDAGLPAIGAKNDIVPGINALKSRLQIAGDGRPRFYVYDYALQDYDESRADAHQPYCFEQEIEAYAWSQQKDGQPVKEVPVKINDHSLDTARYACMYLEGQGVIEPLDRSLVRRLRSYRGF